MVINDKVLLELECSIYKYNYDKNCFQIRNYFNTNMMKLVDEYDKIISVLAKNRIKFKVLRDNTIEIIH